MAWSLISDTALAQSARWTLTPRPRVTKPMISSPGTGVQQLASRTSTSSRPSTWTPTLSAWVRCRPRPQHGGRQLLVVVAAAEAAGHALGDAAGRHVVLADGRQQGVEVDVAVVGDDGLELLGRPHPLDRQALSAELLGELVAALLDHVEARARG